MYQTASYGGVCDAQGHFHTDVLKDLLLGIHGSNMQAPAGKKILEQ
jgi:hypothetical protein